VILMTIIGSLVYSTGGTKNSTLHLFYIPIILAGFLISMPSAIIVGLLCGLIVGPWMPMDVSTGGLQTNPVWLLRIAFFVAIGSFSGFSSSIFRKYLIEQNEKFTTDQTVHLPNVRGLESIFNDLIQQHESLYLLIIDIRNLKELEAAIGISPLEDLLKEVAQDLKSLLQPGTSIGYSNTLGFIVIVPGDIAAVISNYQSKIKLSYTIEHIPIYIEVFYGIARFPDDAQDFKLLLKKASLAVEHGKTDFVPLAYYNSKLFDNASANMILLHDLDQALKDKTLSVAYQPQVNMVTNQVTGVEALSRWNHPTRGEVHTYEFIGLAERTLLINPFTKWMIGQAIEDLRSFHNDGIMLKMSLNVSMRNFHDPEVFQHLIKKAKEFDIKHSFIKVEVTESAVSTDINEVKKVLNMLQEKGFLIAIDDFGTGQASHRYLFELPINTIKIDQMFIKSLPNSKEGIAIIKSAITLAEQLGFDVISEGVDNAEQVAKLIELGCVNGQGFGLGMPMLPAELKNWWKKRGAK
jgi:EAL domain-containing protein (putative c-di-GMP-specific phosphodiesterase class I)/GGDEF domain-containing protein